jgi:hypothetical protein
MTVWHTTGERISTGERGSLGIVRCGAEVESDGSTLAGMQGNPTSASRLDRTAPSP